jgi:hypothetical protein
LNESKFIGYINSIEPVDHTPEQALTNARKDQLRDNMNKDTKSLYLIQNGLDKSIFLKISTTRFSKTTRDILETNYYGITKVNTIKMKTLQMNFENLKMKK